MPDSYAFDDAVNVAKSFGSKGNDVAQMISERFSRTTSEIQELISDSKEAWDFYLRNHPQAQHLAGQTGRRLGTANINRSKKGLRLGLIPRSVDSVLSILHNSIFPSDERFFRGTPKNDVALRYQELYEQYRADNFAESNATEELRRFLLTLELDPAACLAVPWKVKKRKKTVYEAPSISFGGIEIPLPVLGVKEKTINDFVEFEGTVVECLDFNDWRVDPNARSIEDSWFIRRWYAPTWQVERDYDLKNVKPYHTSYLWDDDVDGNQKRLASGLTAPIPFDEEEEGKQQALLMICYDDFVIKGKVYENHVAVTLNGQELIWFGPNPYNHGRVPYIVHSLMPIPNQIYGLSLIKHAIPSAAVVDTAVDRVLKIGSWAAKPVFEVLNTEPAWRESKEVEPGMTIPVKRLGSIQQIQVNVTNLSLLEAVIQKAEDNIREVTGASPVFTGDDFANSPSNITAFQVDQHIQGANSRFQSIMNNFTNSVLEPLLYMSFENDKQFKTKDEYVAVGDITKTLTPELIKQMDFKWLITSAQAANSRGKRLANIRSLLLEIIPPMLQSGLVSLKPQGIEVDPYVALNDMLVLGGLPNANEIIKLIPMQGAMNGLPGLPPNVTGGGGPLPPAAQGAPGLPGAPLPNAGATAPQY